jgi:hypothetical protein
MNMNIEILIKHLRNEGMNYAKDVESPIGHISGLLLEAADALEEQVKLGDDLHTALHHALQCPDVDCIDTSDLCDRWEDSRNSPEMEYSAGSELEFGQIVGDTERVVLLCTKTNEWVPGSMFAGWVAICYKGDERDPFVVWDIHARNEGWYASSGEYFKTFDKALKAYVARGGSETLLDVL